MGENALRLSDHKVIKIGRADVSNLYYLRYEDRDKVTGVDNSTDPHTIENIQWRLPLPDEDRIKPGDYESHQPYIQYDRKTGTAHIHPDCELNPKIDKLFENHPYRPGTFQLYEKKLGLLLNIACYHGLKKNTDTSEVSFGWNGKRSPFALCGILNDTAEMMVSFTCIACEEKWLASFGEIQHLICSDNMKYRLFKLCSKYWEEKNPGKDYPFAMTRTKEDGKIKISLRQWTKHRISNMPSSIPKAQMDVRTTSGLLMKLLINILSINPFYQIWNMKKIKFSFSKYVADDRQQIANLLIDAIHYLIEPDEDFNDSIRKISEYYENMMDCFPVIALSKDDMREAGFNPDNLTDNEMRSFALGMPTDSIMDSYYASLRYHAENDFILPKLHTEMDSLYEKYKKETGKVPLYARIWLEDRGFNNLPWQETVKLTKDVVENEDIYMHFQGYIELKEWLHSTLEADSNSEDVWCYENPEQRIQFMSEI